MRVRSSWDNLELGVIVAGLYARRRSGWYAARVSLPRDPDVIGLVRVETPNDWLERWLRRRLGAHRMASVEIVRYDRANPAHRAYDSLLPHTDPELMPPGVY